MHLRRMVSMIKCHWCNVVLCDKHFRQHDIDELRRNGRAQHRGALITEQDTDFGKECIVCAQIRVLQHARDM